MQITDEKLNEGISIPEELKDALASMDRAVLGYVKSWSDLYDVLLSQIAAALIIPDGRYVSFCLVYLASFLKAMQEMPDEGDAVVLMLRANRRTLSVPKTTEGAEPVEKAKEGKMDAQREADLRRAVEAFASMGYGPSDGKAMH